MARLRRFPTMPAIDIQRPPMNTGPLVPKVLGIGAPPDIQRDAAPWRWWLETAIVSLLGIGAIAGPVALGGVPSLALAGLDLIVAVAMIAWVASAPRSGWLAWMPVAAAAIAAVQLVPLPMPLLAWLAPGSAEAWKGVGDGTWLDMRTISIDPGATAHAMRHMFLGAGVIVVVADLCRDRRRRDLLAGFIAVAGAIVWMLAFVFPMNEDHVVLGAFDLRGPERDVWWCTTLRPPLRTAAFVESAHSDFVEVGDAKYFLERWVIGDGIGSYVVSNHFAAGMYLTIPILLGLCRTRWRGPVWGWGGATLAVLLFAAAIWTVGAQGHSRAGAGATVLAAVVFMMLSSESRRARLAWIAVLVACLAVLLAFALIFFEVTPGLADLLPGDLRDRLLSTLQRERRRELTHVAFRSFLSSPLVGTGLGTFGFLQARMAGATRSTFFAHNDSAQFLAETGLVGCVGLALLVAAIGSSVRRMLRLPFRERMVAAGVCSALAAIALHSFYDWNLHVPANRLLACLVAGLAMAVVPWVPSLRTSADRSTAEPSAPSANHEGVVVPWSPRRTMATVVVAGFALATAYFAVRDHTTEYYRLRLRTALMQIRTAKTEEQRTQAIGRLQWYVTRARSWSRRHPTDSELPLLAGQAVLHLDEHGEGLEGEEASEWFDRARNRNPLRQGFPVTRDRPDGQPSGAG